MAGTERRARQLHKLADKYLEEGKDDKALPVICELLNMNMDDPHGLFKFGFVMRNKGFCGVAAQMFRRAVALDPESVQPWMYFGVCLHDVHQYDAAIEIFQRVRQMSPQEPNAVANIAASYQQMGDYPQAINWADKALEMKPGSEVAQVAKAMASMAMGRWKDAWKGYRQLYGKQVGIRAYAPNGVELPEWDGNGGKTVIVQGEQGLGDEIMFASILPDMAKEVKVIYDCHPKLATIFQRSFPGVEVHGTRKDGTVPWLDGCGADSRHHISSIGRFYRNKDKDFPRSAYLVPNPELMERWRQTLADLPRPWVGLAWQGGNAATMREHRSLYVEDWKPVIDKGGSFIDLSYHDSTREVAIFNQKFGERIVKFDIPHEDYDNTLALLAVLDLVVTVTTTVVHACGAIGQKALVLVPNMPAWRYGWKREDMIWYPKDSVKLFRQEKEEQTMEPAIKRIAEEYGKSVLGKVG